MTVTYQPLKDDGALFRCTECGKQKHANDNWFVVCNNWRGIICKECIDETWKTEFASYIPTPI